MPEKSQKPPETLQAQLATFTAEREGYVSNRSHRLFSKVGDMALQKLDKQDGDSPEEDTSASEAAEYRDYLTAVGGSNYEPIKLRSEILDHYETFEPLVDKLKKDLENSSAQKDHPAFLGNGSNAKVYMVSKGAKKYAVRIPNGVKVNPAAVDMKVAGGILAKGVPHAEQVVAASYKDGVTICEVMPGKDMHHQTHEDVDAVTDDQLEGLVETATMLHEREVEIDPKPSNLFYDTKEGYGVIDFHSSKVIKNSHDQTLGMAIGFMAPGIMHAGRRFSSAEKSAKEYEQENNFIKANYEVLVRYKKMVENKLTGEDLVEAVALIDDQLRQYEDRALNPNWVTEHFAREKTQKEQVIADNEIF